MSRPTLRITESRSGQKSAVADAVQIHSRYDPEQEARRFVQTRLAEKKPLTVVVIGPGLGYITAQLRARCATCKLICLYALPLLHAESICRGDAEWHSGMAISVVEFLRHVLVEEDLIDLEIIVWPPLQHLFFRQMADIEQQTRTVVQQFNANLTTTGSLGRLWLRNALANFLRIGTVLRPVTLGAPVIIAAAGARLERALADIRAVRERVLLWALPSALSALLYRQIVPDLVVLTDPTVYSGEHVRTIGVHSIPIALPLTATRSAGKHAADALLFNQGFGIEHDLVAALAPHAPVVPPNGTVAGSALELALQLGASSVIFAGLDLCADDMNLYARPHAFDHYQWESESRLYPIYSYRYARVAASAHSAHPLFRDWFRSRSSSIDRPVMRLHPSPIDIGLPDASDWLLHLQPLASTAYYARSRRAQRTAPPFSRYERLRAVIRRWQHDVKAASQRLLQQRRLCEIAMTIDMPAYLRAVRDERRGTVGAHSACQQLIESLLASLEHSYRWIERMEANHG